MVFIILSAGEHGSSWDVNLTDVHAPVNPVKRLNDIIRVPAVGQHLFFQLLNPVTKPTPRREQVCDVSMCYDVIHRLL